MAIDHTLTVLSLAKLATEFGPYPTFDAYSPITEFACASKVTSRLNTYNYYTCGYELELALKELESWEVGVVDS